MKKNRYTSHDIAKLANVSRGTVDRVIHNRGKVSEKSKLKVQKVLDEIDYQPNVMAKALSTTKEYKIAVILPSPLQDEYWKDAEIGIDEAQSELRMYNITLDKYFFNQTDSLDFIQLSKTVLSTPPDAVILAPFYYEESKAFIDECEQASIPCVSFNTFIPEIIYSSFTGQDLNKSGQVGASLMHKTVANDTGTLVIVHFDEQISNAMHMLDKEKGFRQYFDDNQLNQWEIQSININEASDHVIYKLLDEVFTTNHNIKGIYVTTSKSYKIAQYIQEKNIKCKLVGYDLMKKNVAFLKQGYIDFLIQQNPKKQVFKSAYKLFDHLILGKELEMKTIIPIDIIIKENLHQHF